MLRWQGGHEALMTLKTTSLLMTCFTVRPLHSVRWMGGMLRAICRNLQRFGSEMMAVETDDQVCVISRFFFLRIYSFLTLLFLALLGYHRRRSFPGLWSSSVKDDLHKEKVISLPHPRNSEHSQRDCNRVRLSTWMYETRIKKKSLYIVTHLAPYCLHYEITEKFNETNRKRSILQTSQKISRNPAQQDSAKAIPPILLVDA